MSTKSARRKVSLALLALLTLLGGCAYRFHAVDSSPARPRVSPPIAAKRVGRIPRVSGGNGYAQGRGAGSQCSSGGSQPEPCASPTPEPGPLAGAGAGAGAGAEGGAGSDDNVQASAPGSSGGAPSSPGSSAPPVVPRPSSKNFSIGDGGIVGGSLQPGAGPQAIRLVLSNPNGVSIFVTRLTVTVHGGSAGCDSAENIGLVQSDVSSVAPLEVHAHGSVTLPARGRSAPTIQLLDLPVNQDACQKARFPLSFTGSAHS